MTQEEAKRILKIYLQAISFQYPWQIAEAIRTLCEPLPLPINLDQAAEEYAQKEYPNEPGSGQRGTGDYEPPINMEYPREIAKDAFIAGAQYASSRWISVDEKLPERDKEVIVLTDELGTAPIYKIGFGHIVKQETYKIRIGSEIKEFTPENHSGWNIPGVKYWMPCPEIPRND